ncbi:MAG: hypothetical protein LUG66_02305 [Clostridiales bacterium]|nr:hypothetical protein [Clostridiales bacterium]
MKKIIALLTVIFIVFSVSGFTAFSSEGEIGVTVDGSEIPFDQPPVVINGRTLVPLRAIFEALGAEVEWDAETKSIMAERNNIAVLLYIDSTAMTYGEIGGNAVTVQLDTAPVVINGRTLVPARAVAEAFGCSVSWDSTTKTVIINDSNTSTTNNSTANTSAAEAQTAEETTEATTAAVLQSTSFDITQTYIKGNSAIKKAENGSHLIDGDSSTKWCCYIPDGGAYVIWQTEPSVVVTGYTIVTGNDNSKYSGRNPLSWTLYGCNSDEAPTVDDSWNVIDERKNDRSLPDADFQDRYFEVTGNSQSYEYYMLKVTATRGAKEMQMSEFELNYVGSGKSVSTSTSASNVSSSGTQSSSGTSEDISQSSAPSSQTCVICGGSGSVICSYCHGKGTAISADIGLNGYVAEGICPLCSGAGKNTCSVCSGMGITYN